MILGPLLLGSHVQPSLPHLTVRVPSSSLALGSLLTRPSDSPSSFPVWPFGLSLRLVSLFTLLFWSPTSPKEGSSASDRHSPHLLGPILTPGPQRSVPVRCCFPHLIDVHAVGTVALQARGAGPTTVARVLIHLHAVHASEAGVGAAVRTLLVEA